MSDTDTTLVLKKTPLCGWHRVSGARMAEFAGWNMPIQYKEGIIAETLHTRLAVSCFDICHMGQLLIKGDAEKSGLERIITISVKDIPEGACRYGSILNSEGGVIDDLIVYRKKQDEWMIVVNASTVDKDKEHFKKLLDPKTVCIDMSDKMGKIDLQGPLAREILKKLAPEACSLSYYTFLETEILGRSALVSRTGYTGELGFELFFPRPAIAELWGALLEDKRVKAAGLGSRDILRLEMGYSLYGQDIDETITPLEAGLERYVDMRKNFFGKEALLQLQTSGLKRQRIFFKTLSRRSPRHLHHIYLEDKICGEVTSGSFSPHLNCGIGMGFAKDTNLPMGQVVTIGDDNVRMEAVITDKPFMKNTSIKK